MVLVGTCRFWAAWALLRSRRGSARFGSILRTTAYQQIVAAWRLYGLPGGTRTCRSWGSHVCEYQNYELFMFPKGKTHKKYFSRKSSNSPTILIHFSLTGIASEEFRRVPYISAHSAHSAHFRTSRTLPHISAQLRTRPRFLHQRNLSDGFHQTSSSKRIRRKSFPHAAIPCLILAKAKVRARGPRASERSGFQVGLLPSFRGVI
jgi:hypothetical protein